MFSLPGLQSKHQPVQAFLHMYIPMVGTVAPREKDRCFGVGNSYVKYGINN